MFVASVSEDGYFIVSQDKQNQIQFSVETLHVEP